MDGDGFSSCDDNGMGRTVIIPGMKLVDDCMSRDCNQKTSKVWRSFPTSTSPFSSILWDDTKLSFNPNSLNG
jgi:hypothetical protein